MRSLALVLVLLVVPLAQAAGWPSAHGRDDNQRAAQSDITSENVATLELAWRRAARAAVTGTPVHDGETVWFADWGGRVQAVNASDGAVRWRVELGVQVDSSLAVSRGVLVVADGAGNLTALDAETGERRWRTWVEPLRGVHLWGSPAIHDGRVYQGLASEQTDITYEGPQDFRGGVACLDLETGEVLWKTYMQPEGAYGVSVWSTPALDPELGRLYVGTGNAYGDPAGDLSDSIVSLRMSDGTVDWHYQATARDAFNARGAKGPDADFGASPILVDLDGRKLVADGDKAGRFFALDRVTGELLWRVTADFVAPGATPPEKEGFLGTAAYANGTFFAPTTDRSMVHAIDARTGRIVWATEINDKPGDYGERMFAPTTMTNDVVLQGNAFGELVALHARDGRVLARIPTSGDVQGGVSVLGDTVFVPESGKVIWSGRGNVSAYRLASPVAPTAAPTSTATPTPSEDPPEPGPGELEGASRQPTVLPTVVVDGPPPGRAELHWMPTPLPPLVVIAATMLALALAGGARRTR